MIDDPTDKIPSDWVHDAKIPDESAVKPADWDEDAPQYIPDPEATKPSVRTAAVPYRTAARSLCCWSDVPALSSQGWLDDAPDLVPDPKAEKPESWDDEEDGEWEAPMVRTVCVFVRTRARVCKGGWTSRGGPCRAVR
jgi:hypothetical protein